MSQQMKIANHQKVIKLLPQMKTDIIKKNSIMEKYFVPEKK